MYTTYHVVCVYVYYYRFLVSILYLIKLSGKKEREGGRGATTLNSIFNFVVGGGTS
jgi:hypothetical protein